MGKGALFKVVLLYLARGEQLALSYEHTVLFRICLLVILLHLLRL